MIRIGTCSWADAGLLATWYPPSVRTPEGRLGYYAERFDVVEVDSPFYGLPSPETAARWVLTIIDGFYGRGYPEPDRDRDAEVDTAKELIARVLRYIGPGAPPPDSTPR